MDRVPDTFQAPTFKLPVVRPRDAIALAPTQSDSQLTSPDSNEANDAQEPRSDEAIPAEGRGSFSQWIVPFYFGALLLCYLSLVIIPYAFIDDYSAVGAALHHNLILETQSRVAGGRVVLAALFELTFRHVHGVKDLRDLRFGAIVTMVILAYLMYRALLSAGMSRRRALPIPLILCTLPGYQIFVAWSIATYAVLAMAAAGAAAMLVERAYDQFVIHKRFKSAALFFGAGAFALLFALAIGQPPAMVYWVFVGISLLVAHRTIADIVKRFVVYIVVAIVSLGIDFIFVKYAFLVIYGRQETNARAGLITLADVRGKISFFVKGPLIDGLNFYNIGLSFFNLVSNVTFAEVMATLIVLGLLLHFRGNALTHAVKLVVALALLPLAYIPNLVIQDSWSSYRTQAGVSGLLALYAVLGICALFDLVGAVGVPEVARFATVPLAAFALLGLVMASTTVTLEMAVPSNLELRVAEMEMLQQRAKLPTATRVYFVKDSWQDAIAPIIRYDEFGNPSAQASWTPDTITYLAIQQVDPAQEDLPVVIVDADTVIPPGSVVLNMHEIRNLGTPPLP